MSSSRRCYLWKQKAYWNNMRTTSIVCSRARKLSSPGHVGDAYDSIMRLLSILRCTMALGLEYPTSTRMHQSISSSSPSNLYISFSTTAHRVPTVQPPVRGHVAQRCSCAYSSDHDRGRAREGKTHAQAPPTGLTSSTCTVSAPMGIYSQTIRRGGLYGLFYPMTG